MKSTRLKRLIGFLRDELAIPSASIDLAVRHQPDAPNRSANDSLAVRAGDIGAVRSNF